MTVASAVTVGASDYFGIVQPIEGFNFSDVGFGTASAKTVTLSFQVYSSLTGTFGASLINYAVNRSYPFSYTVSSANTWTSVSVTIPGDTTGTWVGATNSVGVYVRFGLGSGSTFSSTANAWGAGNFVQPTSTVSVVGTNGATFYITGVQLEVGSVATPFEREIYSTTLAKCQRYYWRMPANGTVYPGYGLGFAQSSTEARIIIQNPVQMRDRPSVLDYGGTIALYNGIIFPTVTSMAFEVSNTIVNCVYAYVASGLTAGNFYRLQANNSSTAYIGIGAEL
jgi:hypothetical protein